MLLRKRFKLDVPHEDGEWFEIRALSWLQMEEARKLKAQDQRSIIKELGPDFMTALGSPDPEEQERAVKALERQKYKVDQYDTGSVLRAGIVDWSYTDEGGASVAVDDEAINGLDERTAMWAAQSIIDVTKPDDAEGNVS